MTRTFASSSYTYAQAIDHLLFVPPAIPIFEAERRFLHERGYDEFVERFERQQVEYADLAREPTV